MTDAEFDSLMQRMPVEWRYRFCGGDPRERQGFGGCACMGAANCSGGIGWTAEAYDRWRAWVQGPSIVKPCSCGLQPLPHAETK